MYRAERICTGLVNTVTYYRAATLRAGRVASEEEKKKTSSVGDTSSCTLSMCVSRSRAGRSYQAMDVPLLCLLPSFCFSLHTPQSDGLNGYTLLHEKNTRHCRTKAVKHPCNTLPCLRLTTPPSPEPLLTPHAMARMAWETTPPQIG